MAYAPRAASDAAYYTKTGGGGEGVVTATGVSTTYNVSLTNGNVHDITLTAATQIVLPTGLTAGFAIQATMMIRNQTFAYTWSANVKWAGGTAPTPSSTTGKTDVVSLVTVDGGTNWQGFPGGLGF